MGKPSSTRVVYMYATSRSAREPIAHLKGFAGVLQVDGHPGYNRIGRDHAVTLALCLSHARRQFYEFEGKEPVVDEVLRRLAVIYTIEAALRGNPPEQRLAGRREQMTILLTELKAYLVQNQRRFSVKSKMTEAINYALNH
jgi:transposase